MALSWAAKRKLIYTLSLLFIIAIPLAIFSFVNFYHAPTCFDHTQNQGEAGIDCGGPCSLLCAKSNTGLKVVWARSFKVNDGLYSALGYVRNDDIHAGIRGIAYEFTIYGKDNELLGKRSGVTFVDPGGQFAIFEPRIKTNGEDPVRTFLTFHDNPTWERTEQNVPKVSVVTRTLTDVDTTPRLSVVLKNEEFSKIKNIQVIAILYDKEGNAIQTSSTYVDSFPPQSEKTLHYTWPNPLPREVSQIEIIPRIDIFTLDSTY